MYSIHYRTKCIEYINVLVYCIMWLVETIQVWVFCHRLDWTISTYAAMLFRCIVGNYFHLIEVYTVACKELWFRPSSLYQYLEDASLAITTAPSVCTYLSQVCKRCSAFFKKKKKKTPKQSDVNLHFPLASSLLHWGLWPDHVPCLQTIFCHLWMGVLTTSQGVFSE